MTAAWALVCAAVAWPNGWPGCDRTGPTIPPGFPGAADPTIQPALQCTGLHCNLTAATQFRGFVISASDPASECATHSSNAEKAVVQYTAAGPTTLWATVVTRHGSAGHRYAVVGPVLVRPLQQHVYIVGAGPGGLAAARYADSLGLNVTVWDRGGPPPAPFYTAPISSTYLTTFRNANPEYKFNPLTADLDAQAYGLLAMVGGLQAVNGAVYAPGTAADLAASVGVSVTAATEAQQLASTYVHWVPADGTDHPAPVGLMQECIDPAACDHTLLAVINPTVSRRAIGYNLPATIQVQTAVVTQVTDAAIVFADQTSVELQPEDVVIVAAGALATPQLLGATAFSGWNHYYKATPAAPVTATTQTFEYPDPDTEINTGNFPSIGGYRIEMTMRPTVREHHVVGQPYALPPPYADGWAQAWHFMGTVNHTELRVPGTSRVYVGDASALMAPFNCHTSMPAAAAGILAVASATGSLKVDPVLPPPERRKVGRFMHVFLAGGFVLAVGVAVHFAPQPAIRQLHYWLAPLGVLLLLIGASWAATHPHGHSSMRQSGRLYHVVGGWLLLVWLVAQASAGVWLRRQRAADPEGYASRFWWHRTAHRASGVVVLVAVAALVADGARSDAPPLTTYDPGPVMGWGIAAAALLATVAATAAFRVYSPRPHTPLNSSIGTSFL